MDRDTLETQAALWQERLLRREDALEEAREQASSLWGRLTGSGGRLDVLEERVREARTELQKLRGELASLPEPTGSGEADQVCTSGATESTDELHELLLVGQGALEILDRACRAYEEAARAPVLRRHRDNRAANARRMADLGNTQLDLAADLLRQFQTGIGGAAWGTPDALEIRAIPVFVDLVGDRLFAMSAAEQAERIRATRDETRELVGWVRTELERRARP